MIRYTHERMQQAGLGGTRGLAAAQVAALEARFPAVQAEVRARRAAGEYGFYGLGAQDDVLAAIGEYAARQAGRFDDLLILGIGGSALGARALLGALGTPAWNELPAAARGGRPRLTILENVDPTTVGAALARLDPRRTLVNVVSKSGGTAETMAQYLLVRAWLEAAVGAAAAEHLVFTTDPARGALRTLAAAGGIATFDVPPAVGGRFSVLTAVGLLPAALLGIDPAALLAGARTALAAAEQERLRDNTPALFAALHHAADRELGAPLHVLMPYTDRFRDLTEWFRQLWAESLGKRLDRGGREVFLGPTPVGAVGATDQHSQVQLFMEGPFDKVVTFLAVDDLGPDLVIPGDPATLPPDLAYLPGHTLGALLRAEYEATSAALARMGRMNGTLHVPAVTAETFGELIMFFQLATGFAGVFYGVDPFDQPGVELGKRLTFAAMGRPGYGADAAVSG